MPKNNLYPPTFPNTPQSCLEDEGQFQILPTGSNTPRKGRGVYLFFGIIVLFLLSNGFFIFKKGTVDRAAVNVLDQDKKTVSDYSLVPLPEPKREELTGKESQIPIDSPEIFNNEEILRRYIKKFGPKQTITRLNELVPLYGSCHDVAHRTGRISYEVYGASAFRQCGSECHSGCYHGATEAFFHDHGTADLAQNLKILCSSELNSFFSHQCIHGIGHGLMAWTNYEIFDALQSCDFLSEKRDSCWTGVFMENIVGSLGKKEGHSTKYLNQDPLYPCTDSRLEEKYKSSCYFLQTSRMIQLFGADFAKIAEACSKAPVMYQRSCFESMGRDVGGTLRGKPEQAIAACYNVPDGQLRIGCLVGAGQDTFWDPSGQDNALNFCRLLVPVNEKNACYNIVFGRASEVLASDDDLRKFCLKAESGYRSNCLTTIKINNR